MSQYAKRLGIRLTPVTPEDPHSNRFVENFVKSVCKVIQTAVAEGKDPKEQLFTFLLQYCATPHSTTEQSPAVTCRNVIRKEDSNKTSTNLNGGGNSKAEESQKQQ